MRTEQLRSILQAIDEANAQHVATLNALDDPQNVTLTINGQPIAISQLPAELLQAVTTNVYQHVARTSLTLWRELQRLVNNTLTEMEPQITACLQTQQMHAQQPVQMQQVPQQPVQQVVPQQWLQPNNGGEQSRPYTTTPL